jgi:hypothetical protein
MRIRLLRAIIVGGKQAEKNSVLEVAKPLARDLIGQGSAVALRRRAWWALAACLALVGIAVLWLGMARGWWVTR